MSMVLKPGTNGRGRPADLVASAGLPAPPSALRAMGILAGITWRRMINQLGLGGTAFACKKSPDESPSPRQATPGKQGKLGPIIAVVIVCLWFGPLVLAVGCLFGCTFVERLSNRLNPKPTVEAEAAPDRSARDQGGKEPAAEGSARKDDDFDRHFTSGAMWPAAPNDRIVVSAVGLLLLLLTLSQLTTLLGTGKQDLGKGEWDMEWLFTFPVPARTLFLTRLIQYAAIGPLQLLFCLLWTPFLAGIFWSAGRGWWALPLAMLVTAYVLVLVASLHLVVEVWLQKHLGPAGRKNVQAVIGLLGGALGLVAVLVWLSPSLDVPLLGAASWLPAAALANPFSLPALLCDGGWSALGAGAAMALLGVAAPLGSVRLAEWLVRDGLLSTPGAYQGRRGRQGSRRGKLGGLFGGIVGKELLLLMRDRAFLVQTLLVPAMLGGFYFLLYRDTATRLFHDGRHTAAVAFGMGVYMLFLSASQILKAEGGSLWLLYTFPRQLHTLLLQKTFLWSGFASLYVLAVLAIAAVAGMPLNGETVAAGGVALVGVVLMAVIVGALGTLSTNPLEGKLERRSSLITLLIGAPLASMYGTAIYAPVLGMIGQMILFALLGVALWQKVQDRIPYLLEPSAAPPRRLSLVDGLVAALAFLNLQNALLALLAINTTLPGGVQWLIAFVAAGAVVALAAFLFLHQVPDLLATTGLVASRIDPRPAVAPALLGGAVAGVLTALVGVAYLFVIDRLGVFPSWKEGLLALRSMDSLGLLATAAVYILAAPLFEEFIFRGLLYQGMRRSMRLAFAVVGSAALFAVVHPPVSVIPAFLLGIAAALVFERSRLLLAPVVTHLVFNAIMVTAQLVM